MAAGGTGGVAIAPETAIGTGEGGSATDLDMGSTLVGLTSFRSKSFATAVGALIRGETATVCNPGAETD